MVKRIKKYYLVAMVTVALILGTLLAAYNARIFIVGS